MTERLVVRTRGHDALLRSKAEVMEDGVWAHLGFLGYTHAHQFHYSQLLREFGDLQICLLDDANDRVLALANCVPAAWDQASILPDEGWDWLVEDGGRSAGRTGNVLGALAISVPAELRGRGYAQRMLREMKALCVEHGFEALIAPVRPSVKHRYAQASIDEYIGWTDELGRCFDPWLRSHYAAGAHLLGVCPRSMVVHQHVAFWETWAGRRFETSGDHVIDGALSPVRIDLDTGYGRYEEPNVWVAYRA